MLMMLLQISDGMTSTPKSKVTCDSSEHTACQRDGPLPRIREVLWIPWVSFVKFNLIDVNILVSEMKFGDGLRVSTLAQAPVEHELYTRVS
jgi:hypothetical protein